MKPFVLCSLPAFLLLVAFSGISHSVLWAQSKGTLQLHPKNPHYFLYEGKPLVLIGSGEHYGSVINLDFEYKHYLQIITRDGLNVTRLFMGSYVEKSGDFGISKNNLAPKEGRLLLPWARSNVPGYVLGGNKFDLTKWNDAYFSRLRSFMTEAQRMGVLVEINLFSSYYEGGWQYSALNPANNINQTDDVASKWVNTLENGNILHYQESYVRKLARELNGFGNFYFEIQNEPWADQTDVVVPWNEYGSSKDWFTTLQVVSLKSRDWQKRMAQWITEEEAKLPVKHLISQNISNFHYPVAEPDPNVSIFNFHYALPAAVTENYYLNKAIGFNETGFAGRADATYRRQAWRFLMAGGSLFNHLDYSFSAGGEDGQDTTYKAPGGGSPALRQQLGVLKRFFTALDVVSLLPDQSVVKASPGAITYALSNAHTQWVIYCEPISLSVYEMTLNLPKGTYQAEWMDAVSGKPLQTATVSNGKLSVPNHSGDKVVVIRASAGNR